MRDNFAAATKTLLARRVGMRCSNPDCQTGTSGPTDAEDGAINIGVAAHITAASPRGPRFDVSLSPDQRSSHQNGIWLCSKCSVLIDCDESRYPVKLLQDWKSQAEQRALAELEGQSTVERREPKLVQKVIENGYIEMVGKAIECLNGIDFRQPDRRVIEGAKRKLEQAKNLMPEGVGAEAALTYCKAMLGNAALATQELKALTQSNPDAHPPHCFLATVFSETQDFSNAARSARMAVEIDDSCGSAHASLAKAHARLGELEEALACANTLVDRLPHDPNSYATRGSLLHNYFDRYEEAIADHVQAIALGGRAGIYFRNYAMSLVMMGRGNEAVHQFELAIEHDPNDALAYTLVGLHYMQRRKKKKARKFFEQALAVDPTHYEALDSMAMLLRSMGNRQEAESYRNRARDAAASYPGLRDRQRL